ncbi:MAG: hypothetical protein IPN69_08710 [Acidobacteria bacterium]|nr:hypothetical protein [Acidobacteriota bacterium]
MRHTIALKRREGLPYKIEISNVDPDPDAMLNDLPVCYPSSCVTKRAGLEV